MNSWAAHHTCSNNQRRSTTTRFEVKNAETGSKIFQLFDLSGKQIYSQVIHNEQFILERKNLNSGFYFYRISGEGSKIASSKLVME